MGGRSLAAAVLLVAGFPVFAQQGPLPDLDDTRVELTWQDFKRLVEAAQPVTVETPDPPREAVLRAAEYRGVLGDGVLELRGRLQIQVLREGWVRLPLWQQGSVVEFSADGASLARHGSGVEILAVGPGAFEMSVTLALVAPMSPGENRLDLVLPDAPLNLVEVAARGEIEALRAEGAVVTETAGGVVRFAPRNGRASLSWRIPFERSLDSDVEEIEREPRVLLSSCMSLDVGDGVLGGLLVQDLQVQVAPVDHFEVDLPEGVEVFDVTAPGLDSWNVIQSDSRRMLRMTMAAPVEGRLRCVVSFEGAYDPEVGRLAVPRFRTRDIERESGFVAVAASGAEVDLELGKGVLPTDPSEAPADVQPYLGHAVAACKYSGAPGEILLTVTEHADAAVLTAVVEQLNATSVVLDNGIEALWLSLAVKNNRKQFLKLALPEGVSEIWSLLVDGEPTRPKRTEDQVLVPLPRGENERSSTIALVLLREGEPMPFFGVTSVALPRFDVPVTEALWTVFLPHGSRYGLQRGAFDLVSESAPLVESAVAGNLGVGLGAAAPTSYRVSEKAVKSQVQQEEAAVQQLKMRQASSRRGALPVRIALPDGVSSLPKITAARILLVDGSTPVLRIRRYPEWSRDALMLLEVLRLGAAAWLLAAWRRRFHLAGVVVLVLLAWWIPGPPGATASAVLVALATGAIMLLRGGVSWWRRRRVSRAGVGTVNVESGIDGNEES